jgi:hypothetical protein
MQRNTFSATILLFSLTLSGCATTYQNMNGAFTGGYKNFPVNDQIEKVIFSGNGYTDVQSVLDFAKYRSAEVAKQNNKPYFLMYESLIDASFNRTSSQPDVGIIGSKPISSCFIRLLDEYQQGALETDVVLKQLEQKVQQGGSNEES